MSETLAPPAGLTTGMRMDWPEFEARWLELPSLKRAELIDGVVHMPSPTSDTHGDPDAAIGHWIGFYLLHTPGLRRTSNPTLVLDNANVPQPDAILRIDRRPLAQRRYGGPLEYARPPVEMAIEVSVTSGRRDTVVKRELYHRFRVREYLIWRVLDDALDWLAWRSEGYEPLTPDEAGVLRSEVFPGLWLDTRALLADDLPALAAAVNAGCATPEHAAFLATLASQEARE